MVNSPPSPDVPIDGEAPKDRIWNSWSKFSLHSHAAKTWRNSPQSHCFKTPLPSAPLPYPAGQVIQLALRTKRALAEGKLDALNSEEKARARGARAVRRRESKESRRRRLVCSTL